MPITKFGIVLVLASWIIFGIFVVLAFFLKNPVLSVVGIIIGIFSIFNLFFFRDPERKIPQNPNAIISPADGKIIQIAEVMENEFFKAQTKRISIFLSVFNVHVNRVPVSGKVEYFRYNKGAFLPAFNEKASMENEQAAIGIVDSSGRKVMFTQIAGIIARRIVCTLREGHQVTAGDRMGMIRYGSRVDVYFNPAKVDLKVSLGDKVKGGVTILGEFK
jgi:phosphatidylserine decarboxylase